MFNRNKINGSFTNLTIFTFALSPRISNLFQFTYFFTGSVIGEQGTYIIT